MSDSHLQFLQGLTEAELTELVLIPLLEAMQYRDIRYTHGILEYGKDIVFSHSSPLEGIRHYCATVKRGPLSGSVSRSRAIREIFHQISQALTEPFIDPMDGKSIMVEKVFVITPSEISQTSIRSISQQLQQLAGRITFLDGPKLLTLINEYLPSLLQSLPISDDARYMYTLCRRFMGIPTLRSLTASTQLTLRDIYTGGSVSPVTPEEARYISFALSADIPQRLLPADVLHEHPYCVILADVGAGKTTLIQKLILDIAGYSEDGINPIQEGIPLYIPLAAIPERGVETLDLFLIAIEEYLKNQEAFIGFLHKSPERFLFFFDGFDELISHHSEVASYLGYIATRSRGVFVTSRPSRIPVLGAPFRYYRVNPFSDDDIREFLGKWFPQRPDVQLGIYGKVTASSILHSFCRTPLMLTLYAILGSRVSIDQLPTRKTDIYTRIVSMLLGEWDTMRNVTNLFSQELKQYVLEVLAYQTHRARTKVFSKETVLRAISDALSARGVTADRNAMLSEIIFRGCLLKPNLHKALEFVHLSFQEFLCAQRLVRLGDVRALKADLTDEWWRNTMIFYFGVTRSLDGVIIPRRAKKEQGMGLRFMEFLSEADFTSDAKRQEIIQMVGTELLQSVELTSSDLEVCRRIGDDLVTILQRMVNDKYFRGKVANFLKVLLCLRTRKASEVLLASQALLGELSAGDLIGVLEDTLQYGKGSYDFSLLILGLKSLPLRISLQSQWSVDQKLTFRLRLEALDKEVRKELKLKGMGRKEAEPLLQALDDAKRRVASLISAMGSEFSKNGVIELMSALGDLVREEERKELMLHGLGALASRLKPQFQYGRAERDAIQRNVSVLRRKIHSAMGGWSRMGRKELLRATENAFYRFDS